MIPPNMESMVLTRRHLHQFPELSFSEFETASFIRQRLSELEIPWRSHATTGTVAHIGTGRHCVAIRADIDALPIEEATGLAYSSRVPGVMHACGHDMHTAMVLEAARILKAMELELPGTIKVIFQPGEERTPGGASLMIADGALEDPTPSFVFGQHVDPVAHVGTVSFVTGPMLAAADEIYITVRGTGSHAAQPHLGRDPIVAASGIVQLLQTFVSRHRDPLHPGVISITSIHGGSATNVIPETVELMGTLRAFDETWRQSAWDFLQSQIPGYCQLLGCEADIRIAKGYPPVVNDSQAVQVAREAAMSVASRTEEFVPKMWAEDFSYYGSIAPSCFWMLGVRSHETDSQHGLHHPAFKPDEAAMPFGAAMMVEVALRALNHLRDIA